MADRGLSVVDSFFLGRQRKREREEAERARTTQQRIGGALSTVFGQRGLQAPAGAPGAVAAPAGIPPQPVAGQPVGAAAPAGAPGAAPQSQDAALAQIFALDPSLGERVFESIGAISTRQREDASRRAFEIRNTPVEQRAAVIQRQAERLRSEGRDPKDTLELLNLPPDQQNQTLRTIELAALTPEQRAKFLPGGRETTAETQTFRDLTEGLGPEDIAKAKLIKLGLEPRAVGSAIQTIASSDIADLIGDAEATIGERKKFGELTGSSRAKIIDSGFERIGKIDVGIDNIDDAIEAVRAGAKTGAIESRFPSIRAASVSLDNIQSRMALDVIGAVTFGALSKGELDLAKLVAIPLGLDGPELIQFLTDKKEAQLKLRDYFREQIDFLDQGGSVAGFLRSKEREASASPAAPAAAGTPAGSAGVQEGQKATNPQTGQTATFINGRWVLDNG